MSVVKFTGIFKHPHLLNKPPFLFIYLFINLSSCTESWFWITFFKIGKVQKPFTKCKRLDFPSQTICNPALRPATFLPFQKLIQSFFIFLKLPSSCHRAHIRKPSGSWTLFDFNCTFRIFIHPTEQSYKPLAVTNILFRNFKPRVNALVDFSAPWWSQV